MKRKTTGRKVFESSVLLLMLAGLTALSLGARADLKLESATSKAVFLNSAGQQITPIEATTQSIQGKKVLKCQEVEAVASDKGNISLKSKK